MNKKILLYYKYVEIEDPETIKAWQLDLCRSLQLKGRIIIAHEGINGTLDGLPEHTDAYIKAMLEHPLFGNIDFKESSVDGQYDYFDKLKIFVKPEIVNLGLDTKKFTATTGGKHLTPQQAHELLTKKPEDFIVFDGRNHYEARVGKFEGAITPEIEHFRDYPGYIDENLDLFKDKQVLMYCTGGVRCERASSYLKAKGVAKEIMQIEGGIHRYVEQFPDGYFRGKNYVFDARIAVTVNDDIVGSCDICNASCDEYTNCINAMCNKQFICCPACLDSLHNACSNQCDDLVQTGKTHRRPLRPRVKTA